MALGICLVLPMHILAMIVLGIIAYFVDHLGTGYSLDQYIFYAIFHIGITCIHNSCSNFTMALRKNRNDERCNCWCSYHRFTKWWLLVIS